MCTEEVVSDMTLPEVYTVETEIHTDVQLEAPMIKSEEKCITQNEPKLAQDMALLNDISTPPQTIAQPLTEQKVYYQTELYKENNHNNTCKLERNFDI